MKVEFTVDECHQMFEAVIENLTKENFSSEDNYSLENWRTNEMKPGSLLMNNLAEKINNPLARSRSAELTSFFTRTLKCFLIQKALYPSPPTKGIKRL